MPVIMICVLMLVLWIRYESNKSKNASVASSEAFWKREQEANHTRNQDTDSLDYIQVDLSRLPILETTSTQLTELQSTLIRIADEKILDLSSYTNTELKLAYGVGKFTYLAQCDANYTTLLQTLEKLANYHLEIGNLDYAMTILEYAIECHCENSHTFIKLANLYAQKEDIDKLEQLKATLRDSSYSNKASILRKIEQGVLETISQSDSAHTEKESDQ